MEIIQYIFSVAFSGFWQFIGVWILLSVPFGLLRGIVQIRTNNNNKLRK